MDRTNIIKRLKLLKFFTNGDQFFVERTTSIWNTHIWNIPFFRNLKNVKSNANEKWYHNRL